MDQTLKLTMQNEKLRAALQALADACDDVGVKHFDTDDLSQEVCAMQVHTQAARDLLRNSQ
jgi:hypothetical protein